MCRVWKGGADACEWLLCMRGPREIVRHIAAQRTELLLKNAELRKHGGFSEFFLVTMGFLDHVFQLAINFDTQKAFPEQPGLVQRIREAGFQELSGIKLIKYDAGN